MHDWFGQPIEVPAQRHAESENPCRALFGPGPDGQTCKGCIHLRYPIQRNPKARFWKCDKRRLTYGHASDHRVSWPACGRYEARTEEYNGG